MPQPKAKPGSTPETCSKCGGRGQVVYRQQTLFGMSQSVQACPDCRGTGKIIKERCTDCRGEGFITARKKIEVSIPAGIDHGQSIRIRGKGEPGVRGGERGDLLVEVSVSSHPTFRRQEMDIFSTVPLPFTTAALGGDIRISTVDGDVLYTVAPGTQTDTKVRLRGKGVPSIRNKQVRGDHYVTLVVQVPTKLTSEQKDLLKQLEASFKGEKTTTSHEEPAKKPEKKGMKKRMEEFFENLTDDDK